MSKEENAIVPSGSGFAHEPCGSCPYRKDSTLRLWHKSEFENLLAHDADEMNGHVFGCHRFRMNPKASDICAGWFLDQQRRNFPSIRLRILLATRKFPTVTDGCHELYSTMKIMCRENGVRRGKKRIAY